MSLEDHQRLIWTVSLIVMVAAILYQIFVYCKHRIFRSDEDYIREYFAELELAERLDLTPISGDQLAAQVKGR